MEHHNVSKSLNDSTVSKFVTKKWIEMICLATVNKNIMFKTHMLRSDLCDYGDAHVIVKGRTDLRVVGNNSMTQKGVTFKNNAPFIYTKNQ